MWNCLDLQSPSSDMVDYPPQDSYLIEDLRSFVTVLTTSANILTLDQPVFDELHVFRNIQAKYRRILHCDKCLVYLARVGHCMRKFIMLNLSKCYLDLAERFLNGFQNLPNTVSLPSRQQVEYILLRTQGAAKLACEAIRYSRETFCFLIKKLKIGHIIIDLVMAASVTARLHILLKTIAVQLSDIYQKIIVWRYKLKQGSFQWAESLTLPLNLRMWLKESEAEFTKPFPMTKSDVEFFKSILKTKTGETESDSDSVICVGEENETSQMAEESFNMTDGIDYGEVIPRQEEVEEFSPNPSRSASKAVPKKKKRNVSQNLTALQKNFLHKILQAQTFKKLTAVWTKASRGDYPKLLSVKKRKTISSFLSGIRDSGSVEDSGAGKKSMRQSQNDASIAGVMLAKHLGFTQAQINDCKSASEMQSANSDSVELTPVKTLKELKVLYRHVCHMLLSTNQREKCKKLSKIFKSRVDDIKLLKQNGEKVTAKKLIFCTSKVILTLYRK